MEIHVCCEINRCLIPLPWIIRIYHPCEGVIEIPIQMITSWHHKACQVMTNGARGLPSDDKWWSPGKDFSIPS